MPRSALICLLWFIIGAGLLRSPLSAAEDAAPFIPADAGLIDVKAAFAAKGDGITDDTAHRSDQIGPADPITPPAT